MTPDATPGTSASMLDLRRYIRWYDDALPREFCEQMVRSFNNLARFHVRNGRGYRQGLEDSSWTELDVTPLTDAGFHGFFMHQIDQYLARYNSELELTIPIPPTSKYAELRMKRYAANGEEKFQPHFDSINQVANRYLVFLWYLNDVDDGGETEFVDLGVKVQARTGRLLIFPPYWMYQHAGLVPRSSDKYIVSTYMLFPDTVVRR
jgi:2-oxoglutarate-Fe(II)-dependent oxygenase superfamily protein